MSGYFLNGLVKEEMEFLKNRVIRTVEARGFAVEDLDSSTIQSEEEEDGKYTSGNIESERTCQLTKVFHFTEDELSEDEATSGE